MSKLLVFSVVLCSCIIVSLAALDVDVQNKNVDRTIDLSSQIVKISYKITLTHKSNEYIKAYDFVLPEEDRSRLAYLSIKDATKQEKKYVETKTKSGTQFTIINLPMAAAGTNQVLYIETQFTKSITPFPTEIQQSDRQLVRYFGNAYFYSPYTTLTQKTTVHLSSKNVESYTNVKPSSQSDTTITYGPYDNVAGNFLFFFFLNQNNSIFKLLVVYLCSFVQ